MKPACPEFVVHYDPQKHTVKWISSLSRRKELSYFINIHYDEKKGVYPGFCVSRPIPNSRKPYSLNEFFRGCGTARAGTVAKLFICTEYMYNGPCRSEEIEIVVPEILPSRSKSPLDAFPTPM